ncbi:MAG: hypothetical protein FWE41_01795 [Coriobacteriia bacterium]|nr:hypothetical protein [Coriobacteriia bacterium]
MKKIARIMLAAILAMTLSLGMVPAAHADPVDPTTINTAAITKVLKVPVGTDYPAMTFEFEVERVGFNDTTNIPANFPQIGTVFIAFDGATATSRTEALEGTVAGVSTYYLESHELLAAINWPTAGKYEYKVTEVDTNYTILDPLHEAMELSLAEYSLSVYVREYNADDAAAGRIPAGKSIGDRYIYAVGMIRVVSDDGVPGYFKGDPTPGGNQVTTFYSDMIFTNKYVKTNGADDPDDPDPTDPGDSTLNITKTVAGDMGSIVLPFDFTITVNVPTLIPSYQLDTYKAYLVAGNNVLDPSVAIDASLVATLVGTDSSGMKYLKIAPFTAVAFKLTHGQSLVFINTPVGTNYSISEAGVDRYTASVRVTTNNVQGGPTNGTAAGTGVSITGALVGEALNKADFTNTFDLTPPSGLTLENLPFYLMVLLALGALVVFVVAKRRKRQEEE